MDFLNLNINIEDDVIANPNKQDDFLVEDRVTNEEFSTINMNLFRVLVDALSNVLVNDPLQPNNQVSIFSILRAANQNQPISDSIYKKFLVGIIIDAIVNGTSVRAGKDSVKIKVAIPYGNNLQQIVQIPGVAVYQAIGERPRRYFRKHSSLAKEMVLSGKCHPKQVSKLGLTPELYYLAIDFLDPVDVDKNLIKEWHMIRRSLLFGKDPDIHLGNEGVDVNRID